MMTELAVGETSDWQEGAWTFPCGDGIYWAPESEKAIIRIAGWNMEKHVMKRDYGTVRWWLKATNEEARRTCCNMAVDIGIPFYEAKIDLRRTNDTQWKRIV